MRKDGDCQRQDRKGGEGRRCTVVVPELPWSGGGGAPETERKARERWCEKTMQALEQKPRWPESEPGSQNRSQVT